MKKLLFGTVAMALLCCVSSCKKNKETEMVTLRLQCEQPTDPTARQKVYLDADKLVNWCAPYTYQKNMTESPTVADSVKIFNGSATDISIVENYTASATISSGANYTAVSPVHATDGVENSVSNASVTVHIPAIQEFIPGPDGKQNIKDLPMGAYLTNATNSSTPVLMFRNLGSLIRVTVNNPSHDYSYRVTSIKLSSTDATPVNLHGTYKWDFKDNNTPTSTNNFSPATYVQDKTPSNIGYRSEIMLDFNHYFKTIAPAGSESFYIVVAPITSTCTFRIQVRGAVLGSNNQDHVNGEPTKIHTRVFDPVSHLYRSHVGTIYAKLDTNVAGVFTVSGGFSTSASSVVYFSPGNLALGYNGQNGMPVFHTRNDGEQYQHVSCRDNAVYILQNDNNPPRGTTEYAHRYLSLFRYSSQAINDLSTTMQISTYYPYIDVNGYKDVGVWRIPTTAEMRYVLGIDGISGRSITNDLGNARYARACIDGSYFGMILFPDVYEHPAGITITYREGRSHGTVYNPKTNSNEPNYLFTHNSITHAQWKLMEAAGAVFLPTTGLIAKGNVTAEGHHHCSVGTPNEITYFTVQDNSTGYYWTDITSADRLYMQDRSCTETNVTPNVVFGYQFSVSATNTIFYHAIRPIRN